jgi:hypothetical protein
MVFAGCAQLVGIVKAPDEKASPLSHQCQREREPRAVCRPREAPEQRAAGWKAGDFGTRPASATLEAPHRTCVPAGMRSRGDYVSTASHQRVRTDFADVPAVLHASMRGGDIVESGRRK